MGMRSSRSFVEHLAAFVQMNVITVIFTLFLILLDNHIHSKTTKIGDIFFPRSLFVQKFTIGTTHAGYQEPRREMLGGFCVYIWHEFFL